MKRKLFKKILIMFALCVLNTFLYSCSYIKYNDYISTDGFDKTIFYRNDGLVQAADPCVITVDDTYYMYATNAEFDGNTGYLKGWKSKNLSDWTELGPVFIPQRDAWAINSLWAPEVIEKDGTYYMYYSGLNSETGKLGIGVATSDNPEGPFKEIQGVIDGKQYSHKQMPIDFGFPCIDANPFIDDNGDVYLYVALDQVSNKSSIYVAKLKSNMVEIEEIFDGPIIEPSQDWESINLTNTWNEAPFLYKHNGKYYLFYSANYYQNSAYAVGVAISDNPTSGFVKSDSNPILEAFPDWTYVSGTGHNSIFHSVDKKELFIAYHSHIDVNNGGSERKINFDRISFDQSGTPVVSGPSITPQLLPSGSSTYYNIAPQASISFNDITNNDNILVDGIINYKAMTADIYEYYFESKTTISLKFDKDFDIKAIMVYDSCLYSQSGKTMDITIGNKKIKGCKFNPEYSYIDEYDYEIKQPGSSAIIQFKDVTTNIVTITIDGGISLSEIVIVGK